MSKAKSKYEKLSEKVKKISTDLEYEFNTLTILIQERLKCLTALVKTQHKQFIDQHEKELLNELLNSSSFSLSTLEQNLCDEFFRQIIKLYTDCLISHMKITFSIPLKIKDLNINDDLIRSNINKSIDSIRKQFYTLIINLGENDLSKSVKDSLINFFYKTDYDLIKPLLGNLLISLDMIKIKNTLHSKHANRTIQHYLREQFKVNNELGFNEKFGLTGDTVCRFISEIKQDLINNKNQSIYNPQAVKWLLSLTKSYKDYNSINADLQPHIGYTGKPEAKHRKLAIEYIRKQLLFILEDQINTYLKDFESLLTENTETHFF